MTNFVLRDVQPVDVEKIIALAKVAVADENEARGLTADGMATQMRLLTRGRMIPVRLLLALAQVRWGLIVAEQDGTIVGCGGFSGRGGRYRLHTSMVAPEHRRQGIAQAILTERLRRIQAVGGEWVVADVLSTNEASLGNLTQQGLTPLHTSVEYEIVLDRQSQPDSSAVVALPVSRQDQPHLRKLSLELRAAPTGEKPWLSDPTEEILRHPMRQLMDTLVRQQNWVRRFEREGQLLGYLFVSTTPQDTKGFLAQPLVSREGIAHLPALMNDAFVWLRDRGKQAAQMTTVKHPELEARLLEMGWVPQHTWLRLAKRLTSQPREAVQAVS